MQNGCTFYAGGLCALFDSGFSPLECRFCHHDRQGQGAACHAALEKEPAARSGGSGVIKRWPYCNTAGR
ncbi:MAG: hypothetical protein R2912_05105 [Eubacteriales bacterium]